MCKRRGDRRRLPPLRAIKLRFAPRATNDLSEIALYLHAKSPQAALRVRAAILESLQYLLLFPRAGRRQTIEGLRKHVVRRYPYLIYYIVDETNDEIVVVSIMHPLREQEFSDA
ncbi:type II toxin-antitoxin system RelE/ParE family toxin [Pseudorhodoplanes sp.]|uniref:type II toxin-antitoxin system RelE/ParE family toxin n=1 Tax=Pseudorhodoplanes sp. TaxID=1934341 RepID=UPI003918DDE7